MVVFLSSVWLEIQVVFPLRNDNNFPRSSKLVTLGGDLNSVRIKPMKFTWCFRTMTRERIVNLG
jgi:hypothetical protein